MGLKPRLMHRWRPLIAAALLVPAAYGCARHPRRADRPVPPPRPSTVYESDPTEPAEESAAPDLSAEILATAASQLGRLYRWGGSSPEQGFDCSGFVQWVFARHDIELPRSSREQATYGTAVPAEELLPGDLVFFSRTQGSSRPYHVGIYTGDGEFIHSPGTGRRIRISRVRDGYFSTRFLGARRVWVEGVEAATESASSRVYVVRPGDYVWKIARKFGVSPQVLLEINNLAIEDVIQPGLRILIPNGNSP